MSSLFLARSKRTQSGKTYRYWQLKFAHFRSLGSQTYRQQQLHIASLGKARGNACQITESKAHELVAKTNQTLNEKGIDERISLDDLRNVRRLKIDDEGKDDVPPLFEAA